MTNDEKLVVCLLLTWVSLSLRPCLGLLSRLHVRCVGLVFGFVVMMAAALPLVHYHSALTAEWYSSRMDKGNGAVDLDACVIVVSGLAKQTRLLR